MDKWRIVMQEVQRYLSQADQKCQDMQVGEGDERSGGRRCRELGFKCHHKQCNTHVQ